MFILRRVFNRITLLDLWGCIAAVAFGIVLSILVFGSGCTNPEAAERAVRAAGYRDAVIIGWGGAKCGDGYTTCTEFSAVAPNGQRVHGYVGCGVTGCGKACTIRW